MSGKFDDFSQKKKYGASKEEQTFNISLQLIITWINRILFIKLLEDQLKSIKDYSLNTNILSNKIINDTHDLQELFFQVLAIPQSQRQDYINEKFKDVPYLNSSLFELTELEKIFFSINSLNNLEIDTFKKTVIEKKKIKIIDYIIEFFSNYSFNYHGDSQHHDFLLNPSVLGLVFEKLNGYKEGSYYTPTTITSLMTTKTIENAVIDKFNYIKNWNCKNLIDLYNKIEDIKEANLIVESIKICDPAVGSGHFLVSALNKLISIKFELGILVDEEKKRIKYFDIKNVNDDLIILDDDKEFVYNPKNKESHRLQMTLFNEKKKIIEKTLFGVDINPNSVNICRLRLWIELLKSSYIKNINSTSPQFETLPNIDINIKQGDSLLSLYNVDSNLSLITKDSKYKVEDYRDAITRYVSTNDKNEKKNLVVLIEDIKKSFKNKIKTEQKKLKKKRQLTTELFELDNQLQLFETSSSKEVKEKRKTLIKKINEVNLELEKIEERKHIDNIFEWRFEFPEILNENADFIGFDIIVGNPPYFNLSPSQKQLYEFGDVYKHVNNKITNITSLFIYLSLFRLLKPNGYFSFIVPKSITFVDSWKRIRESILNKTTLLETYDVGKAFEGVGLEQVILICKNTSDQSNITKTFQDFKNTNNISQSYFTKYNIILNSITPKVLNIITSLQKNTNKLCEIAEFPRATNISGKDRTSIKSENCVLYLG